MVTVAKAVADLVPSETVTLVLNTPGSELVLCSWTVQVEPEDKLPAHVEDMDQLLRDLLVAGGTAVEVHGHTDNVGTEGDNQILSLARAEVVRAYLIQNFGLPSEKLTAKGAGQTVPISMTPTPLPLKLHLYASSPNPFGSTQQWLYRIHGLIMSRRRPSKDKRQIHLPRLSHHLCKRGFSLGIIWSGEKEIKKDLPGTKLAQHRGHFTKKPS